MQKTSKFETKCSFFLIRCVLIVTTLVNSGFQVTNFESDEMEFEKKFRNVF